MSNLIIIFYLKALVSSSGSRDRIVVSTLRCGRNDPGSNPGHGTCCFNMMIYIFPTAVMSSLVLICDVMFLSSVFGLFHLSSLYSF